MLNIDKLRLKLFVWSIPERIKSELIDCGDCGQAHEVFNGWEPYYEVPKRFRVLIFLKIKQYHNRICQH